MLRTDTDPFSTEPPARIFTRELECPRGAPWDQHSIAELDARSGAPAPIELLMTRVVRIGAWRPGRPARFLIAYARKKDLAGGLTARVIVAGRSRLLRFEPPSVASRRRRAELLTAAAVGVSAVIIVAAVPTALERRSTGEDIIAAAERSIEVQLRQARRGAEEVRETRLVQESGYARASLRDVMKQFTDIGRAREPTSRVEAIHWNHGITTAESAAQTSPFGSRLAATPSSGRSDSRRRTWTVVGSAGGGR